MTVRDRLVLTFAVVGGLLVLPALFAALRLTDLRDLAVEERGRQADATLAVGRVEAGLVELNGTLRRFAATRDERLRDAGLRILGSLETELQHIEEAGYVEASPPLAAALTTVGNEVREIDRLMAAGEVSEATDRFEGFDTSVEEARARLQELAGGIAARAEADFERARAISTAARQSTVLAVAIAVVLTALLATWTTRAVTLPLRRVGAAMSEVAEGRFELPADLPYDRKDEIGDLAVSFQTMTRRLAELDRLKAEFMGVASHELKTPINVIRGYTELIEEELAGEITEHQREIMQRIGEQTRVLTRQVSRLMDISRLETGSYVLEPETVLVEDLILGVQRAFEVLAAEKGVEFATEIEEGTPPAVEVDVDIVRDEVLSNLVSNALKFTPEGGRVSVTTRGDGGLLVIEVADTGPGISPEHRGHVFEKYYQVERSRSVGSGLGLAIAREMAEAHGGTIDLLDKEPPGATFLVRLPARLPTGVMEGRRPRKAPSHAGVEKAMEAPGAA